MAKKYLALVVEDDPDLSTIFASALRSAGFEVEVIGDGGKALARLAEIVPHIVILDLHLPHLSGANTLRQIHSDRRLIETRVVICTADAAMANELGKQADLVLLKPVMFSQLRDLAIRLVPGVMGPAGAPLPEATPPGSTGTASPDAAVSGKEDSKTDGVISPQPGSTGTASPDAAVSGKEDSKTDGVISPQPDRPAGS